MRLLRPVVGIAGPTALYYLLRHLGASVYVALLVGAVVSLAPAVLGLVTGLLPGWQAMRLRIVDALRRV